jgi:hypothetical protein
MSAICFPAISFAQLQGADMFANLEMVDRIAGAGAISLAIAIFGFCPSCVVPGLKTRQAKGAG